MKKSLMIFSAAILVTIGASFISSAASEVKILRVEGQSLSPASEIPDPAPADSITDNGPVEVSPTVMWTSSSVHVRDLPSIDSSILATLERNTPVARLTEIDGWTKISYNNGFAYINSEYLSETEVPAASRYYDLINSLTENEKYLIYQITYAEAGNQKMVGQRAVIEVILNRVMSSRYPNTVEGVLSQKGQFATWKLRNKVKHNQEQITALSLVATEEPVLSADYLMFATKKNKWGKNYVKIQDHWFGTF